MKARGKTAEGAKAGSRALPANRVYDIRRNHAPYSDEPACIHFYYVGVERKVGKETVRDIRRYFFADRDRPIPYDEAEYHIRNLAFNAVGPRADQLPPPEAEGLGHIVWYRKCYLAFFIDDPKLTLQAWNAVTFNPPVGSDYSPNHSFFDAWDMKIDLGNGSRTGVGLIDHMKKNADGNTLGRAKQRFYFKLNFNESPIFFPDSGGTNMGPPVPPP